MVLYVCAATCFVNSAVIMRDAYKKAVSKTVFFKMLVPITVFAIGFRIMFSSPNSQYCLTSAIFASMFVFNTLTLRIIVCSITRVS